MQKVERRDNWNFISGTPTKPVGSPILRFAWPTKAWRGKRCFMPQGLILLLSRGQRKLHADLSWQARTVLLVRGLRLEGDTNKGVRWPAGKRWLRGTHSHRSRPAFPTGPIKGAAWALRRDAINRFEAYTRSEVTGCALPPNFAIKVICYAYVSPSKGHFHCAPVRLSPSIRSLQWTLRLPRRYPPRHAHSGPHSSLQPHVQAARSVQAGSRAAQGGLRVGRERDGALADRAARALGKASQYLSDGCIRICTTGLAI
jgi:hypothetical protein